MPAGTKKQTPNPARLVAYLGGLTLAGGDHDGALFDVLPWERRFIRGAFGVSGDAALSVSRGNGKSAIVAGVACAVVDPEGPLHGRRREVVCVASSFSQGKLIFEDALAFLGERHDLADRKTWRIQDTANNALLEHRRSGARIRCIGSDPSRAHGLRPALVLADEPAQWSPAKADRMLAALRTGLGKVPGSKLIALGTRPAGEGHWFARMLRNAPYSQVHAARPEESPFSMVSIRRANPSYDHLPTLRERLRTESDEARESPELLASWRALRLNLGTSDIDERVILERGSWRDDDDLERDSAPPVVGIDLGSGAAMCAAAAVWESGRMEVIAAFPGKPDLAERGRRDGAAYYETLAERGELIQLGRATVPVEEFLQAVLDRFGVPACIVADRWREGELRDAMYASSVIVPLVLRGQGYYHGGEDLRAFRRAMLDGHVSAPESRLFRAAVLESRAVCDPAGNEKLAKSTEGGRRRRARDDAVAAAIVAVAEWWRRRQAPPEGLFVAGAADDDDYNVMEVYR